MFSIIAATAENNAIGYRGEIPWNLPRDLKYFAAATKGRAVIMGRKTYESILAKLGTPLPGRKNIVVSRRKNFTAPGCTVVRTLAEARLAAPPDEEVFVVGGGELYAEAMGEADRIYRTLVHAAVQGDTFFPPIDPAQWEKISTQFEKKDEKNPFDMEFEIYERKQPRKTALPPGTAETPIAAGGF